MKYDPKSEKAEEFINDEEILRTMEFARREKDNRELLNPILKKAEAMKGLDYKETALLLCADAPDIVEEINRIAAAIKDKIYGNRIVFFAPLYLSNYCVNSCRYCGFHKDNQAMQRKKLTQQEIAAEVTALQDMGHKRLALETGEHPVETPVEYVIESIKTIYSIKHKNGAIRRVNVNIAATTSENYRKLKEAGIGTYILFQETYNKRRYEYMHPKGPKSNYAYHTEAMDRAMIGGIDDVGLGVLYGLSDYLYDTIGLMMHVKHLEEVFAVGPHTISVPRMRFASDVDLKDYTLVTDALFRKIVAVLRCAVPYTGMIVSTRESAQSRAELLRLGVTQLSGGSCTGVGGYACKSCEDTSQFQVDDMRSLDEIVCELLQKEYIPSFCTACYREGRTGERFMELAKTGTIGKICQPNALLTLKEYLTDYAGEQTKIYGEKLLAKELSKLKADVRERTEMNLKAIENGERDFRF